jgi:hypothetical protein
LFGVQWFFSQPVGLGYGILALWAETSQPEAAVLQYPVADAPGFCKFIGGKPSTSACAAKLHTLREKQPGTALCYLAALLACFSARFSFSVFCGFFFTSFLTS